MLDILKVVPTPQAAMTAMCDGLERQDKRSEFHIDMDFFLTASDKTGVNVCCGCAATCAVQQIARRDYNPKFIAPDDAKVLAVTERALYFDIEPTQLMNFEYAMDSARLGLMGDLYAFYGLPKPKHSVNPFTPLNNNNWRDKLKGVRKWIEKCEKLEKL